MLLAWLDPDRDEAGRKYETIRRRLIKLFVCRGCCEAEELADETINRVTLKVEAIREHYVGDPAFYFYGVAQKIHQESLRRKTAPPPPPAAPSDEIETEYECLEMCMQRLTAEQRTLVLEYYREDRQAKIAHRKELARRLDIALNALRIRAHRIRLILRQCVLDCLEERAAS